MLLAIDIGNTNIVFALYDGEKLVQSWRSETGAAGQYSELEKHLPDIEDIIVSSVVPQADEGLLSCLDQAPIFVTADNVGIEVHIENPEEAGADRLVNARAVLEYYQAPAIVVDFGTATTFDVIGSEGHYEGGVIAPGVHLSVKALHSATAKLPTIQIIKPDSVIGKNTESAIQSGIYWGYIGLVEGILQKIATDMNTKPLVIATGGLAPLFAGSTEMIDKVDEELTLKGLQRIYHSLKKQQISDW